MKVLVIGEAPSRWAHERGITAPLPLVGLELAAMASIDWPCEWHDLFQPVSVLDKWPGKQGKVDAFPMDLARPAARKLWDEECSGKQRSIVLLGRRVERAFFPGIEEMEFFDWCDHVTEGWRLAVAAHPSHSSHWWNEADHRRQAQQFWAELAAHARDAALVKAP